MHDISIANNCGKEYIVTRVVAGARMVDDSHEWMDILIS